MKVTTILSAAGIAALTVAAPVLSQGKSGGTPAASRGGGIGATAGGGMGAGPVSPNAVGARSGFGLGTAANAGGNVNASTGFTSAMDLRAAAQTRRANVSANSQGSANASATGRARANANSGLNDGTIADLSLLATGMALVDADGDTVGTVVRVIRSPNGTVRNVLVRLNGTGRVYVIPPSTLSVSGTTVTTTLSVG